MAEDYYKTLGVNKEATKQEIKQAYRKLAHKYHPDKKNGDAEMFKKINGAHEVLSDDKKRQQYDQFGQVFEGGPGFQGQSGASGFDFSGFSGGGFSDIFEEFFTGGGGGFSQSRSRTKRGNDIEMHLTLKFKEAIFGVQKTISIDKLNKCENCSGTGVEKGHKMVTCVECQGQGQIKRAQNTILGKIITTATCSKCNGNGEIPEVACSKCHGQGRIRSKSDIKISVPAGVDNGSTIRVSGQGEIGVRGVSAGDLYLHLLVKDSEEFLRDGFNIITSLDITISQAVLGDEVKINTVDSEMLLKIPAGIQSGKILKITGRGVPMRNTGKRGDHLITVNVIIPKNLSSKELDLFNELAKITNKDIKPQKKGGIFW